MNGTALNQGRVHERSMLVNPRRSVALVPSNRNSESILAKWATSFCQRQI
jgi:hypothetical protein